MDWITMFLLPVDWTWVLAGFSMFRLFEIWKPGPIRWCDRNVEGGFGIMLDDVIAGVCACLVLHGLRIAVGAS